MLRLSVCLLLGLLTASSAFAQHDHTASAVPETKTFLVEGLRIDPASPPPGSAVARAGARLEGGGYLHVVYGRPYTRGRQIFGGLIGYGQVWSLGAHIATELAVTVPVTIGGTRVEPGVYSLFVTPRPDRWTLHVNRVLGMHLADEYDAANDIATVDVIPLALPDVVQGLMLDFVPAGTGADMRIRWDRTLVVVPIRVP